MSMWSHVPQKAPQLVHAVDDVVAQAAQRVRMVQFGQDQVVTIGANCLLQTPAHFYLVAEIEASATNVDISQYVFIVISQAQFLSLQQAGLGLCTIQQEVPTPAPGFTVELACIFTDGSATYAVFDVENATDTAVLVPTSICPIVGTP